MIRRAYLIGYFISFIGTEMSWASVSPHYIERVARDQGVPAHLLKSIAFVESGVEGLIWPWTVNVRGKSYYFKTHYEAKQFLNKCLRQDITRMDIGCLQINWHWHRHRFTHPADLLNPRIAIPYAASLLKENKKITGSWMKAALMYHSKDQVKQARYALRLKSYLKSVSL